MTLSSVSKIPSLVHAIDSFHQWPRFTCFLEVTSTQTYEIREQNLDKGLAKSKNVWQKFAPQACFPKVNTRSTITVTFVTPWLLRFFENSTLTTLPMSVFGFSFYKWKKIGTNKRATLNIRLRIMNSLLKKIGTNKRGSTEHKIADYEILIEKKLF